MVRILSTLSSDGQLYRVDLRLRPSGRQGDLIRSVSSLRDYFRRDAETWEMQSFLKARPVAGDPSLGLRAVEEIEVLILDRARGVSGSQLAVDVDGMRRRLSEAGPADAERPNVKLGDGGLLDVHFLIEYLQLRHGIANPEDMDTLRLLTHLNQQEVLGEQSMRHLYEGYLFLRALDHEMRLIHDPPLEYLPADDRRRRELALAMDPLATEGEEDTGDRLIETYRRHAHAIRAVYESIVARRKV